MKTQKFIRSLKFVILFVITTNFFNSIHAQAICTYSITNNLGCPVEVSFEYIDATCLCPSGCIGPEATSVVNGGGALLIPTYVCTGAIDINMRITMFSTTSAFTTLVAANGAASCSTPLPTNDSGSIPSAAITACGGSTFSFIVGPSGGVIDP